MKSALLICTFNRPKYLNKCLLSLAKADLSRISEVLIVDDCSTDAETLRLIKESRFKLNCAIIGKSVNCGIKDSLLIGYNNLFQRNDIVINLDSDAVVRNDFVDRLLDIYTGGILTGFHSTTRNANGTERHKITDTFENTYFKQSVGGINMCINKAVYEAFVKPALLMPGNWDHNACINSGGAYCLKQSVIDHIGFDSSMGHFEQPDTADSFYFYDLKDVTLLCIDSRPHVCKDAVAKSTKHLKFADTVVLHPLIATVEQYSRYVIKEAYKRVKTSHMLIIQHDGYVINPMQWDNEWLKYDYIGATWWYQDGMNVGNGGFSLRGKRLMEIVATDPNITQLHPEDHHICRTYRPYLEKKYGIKFAPEHVADAFSYEGYRQFGKKLGNQFGFHGKKNMENKGTGRKYVFNQFKGLGDILFLVPMYRALVDEGNEVIWPIAPEHLNIQKHFPDINFVDMNSLNIDYNNRAPVYTEYGRLLPYRFAIENMGKGLVDCMRAKYEMYGHDYTMWRELQWQRDAKAEKKLLAELKLPKKFILVNRYFGGDAQFTADIKIKSKLPVIEMSKLDDYTLIDWLTVAEKATEIHVANSSIMYLLEIMKLDIPTHVYKRGIWGEQGFEYTKYLWLNDNFIFEK